MLRKQITSPIHELKRILMICFAAILFAVNIKIFVQPGNLFPGGFTGLTLLFKDVAKTYLKIDIPYTLIIFILNLIPAILSYKYIGKKFTIYSCLMLIISSILVDVLPNFSVVDDVLLSSVFGGLISAFCGYICLLAGATCGGTDFIAILISEKYSCDAWNYVLFFNIFVLGAAGILFGWERALYSILYQFAATELLNVVYKRYQKATLFIITNKYDEVYKIIKDITNHDATLFNGTGCFKGAQRELLYSVVAGDEAQKVAKRVKDIDPCAFINIVRSQQIVGLFYNKPKD